MRVAVVGNCQVEGIARSVEALLPGAEATAYQLSQIAKGKHPEGPLETCYRNATQADLTLVFTALPKWQRLFTKETLETDCRKLVFYPSIAFPGYHPDCDYIPAFRQDATGPMGPYHSIIACAAYRLGLSPARTAMLYNRFVYARLGFSEVFDAAIATMRQEGEAVGFDLHRIFGMNRSNMHIINHPHVSVLTELARQALAHAGIAVETDEVPDVTDNLQNFRWPVYPGLFKEIPGSLVFSRGRGTNFELGEFIEREFETFAGFGPREAITSPAIERAIRALEPELVN